MSKWRKLSKRMRTTGHGNIRNVQMRCDCGCGTELRINIFRDEAFPQIEISIREGGAKRWRGAVVRRSDALRLCRLIETHMQPEKEDSYADGLALV